MRKYNFMFLPKMFIKLPVDINQFKVLSFQFDFGDFGMLLVVTKQKFEKYFFFLLTTW